MKNEQVIGGGTGELREVPEGDPGPAHAGRLLGQALERGFEVTAELGEGDGSLGDADFGGCFDEAVTGEFERLQGLAIAGEGEDGVAFESPLAGPDADSGKTEAAT